MGGGVKLNGGGLQGFWKIIKWGEGVKIKREWVEQNIKKK